MKQHPEKEVVPAPSERVVRRPYQKPEIVHELELVTRAGSTITGLGVDPYLTGTDPFLP